MQTSMDGQASLVGFRTGWLT